MVDIKPRLSSREFLDQIADLREVLARKIEADVTGFADDAAAKAARVKSVIDVKYGFSFFVNTYFPHYITSAPNALHQYVDARLPRLISEAAKGKKGVRLNIVAPRGSAKSTRVTQLFSLWCVICGFKKFIIIGMDAYEQAALMLEAIKIELEDNPRLNMDFPKICGTGRRWREGEIITRNHIRLEAVGSRQKVRGRRHGAYRPDLVIL